MRTVQTVRVQSCFTLYYFLNFILATETEVTEFPKKHCDFSQAAPFTSLPCITCFTTQHIFQSGFLNSSKSYKKLLGGVGVVDWGGNLLGNCVR